VIRLDSLVKYPVAIEKLRLTKFAKIKLRQEALQMTFSVFLDIFYPPIVAVLTEMEFFVSDI